MFDFSKTPKKKKEDFVFADFIELYCLSNEDKISTKPEIIDAINESIDFNVDSELSEILVENTAESRDLIEGLISEKFSHITSRSKHYGEFYPFEIDNGNLVLKKELSEQNKCYLFLLICSNLRNLKDESKHYSIRIFFETVCLEVLNNLFPANTEVTLFSSQNKELGTTALDRVNWFAEKLNTEVIADEDEFKGNVAGEMGLDIVVWFNFNDNWCNRPIFLVQCTCGRDDIETKANNVSSKKWNKILNFTSRYSSILCIPHSYRNESNDFYSKIKLGDSILIDRQRILEYSSNVLDCILKHQDALELMLQANIVEP